MRFLNAKRQKIKNRMTKKYLNFIFVKNDNTLG